MKVKLDHEYSMECLARVVRIQASHKDDAYASCTMYDIDKWPLKCQEELTMILNDISYGLKTTQHKLALCVKEKKNGGV